MLSKFIGYTNLNDVIEYLFIDRPWYDMYI
jgi:hypothetical protein